MKLTGQCHCGQLAYVMDDEKLARADCDCRECQRATGALKVPFVSVAASNFKITRGTPTQYKAPTGEQCDKHGHWMFCRDCGTMILWAANSGNFYTVLAGTIDQAELVGQIPAKA